MSITGSRLDFGFRDESYCKAEVSGSSCRIRRPLVLLIYPDTSALLAHALGYLTYLESTLA
jgi:hypothetical protein